MTAVVQLFVKTADAVAFGGGPQAPGRGTRSAPRRLRSAPKAVLTKSWTTAVICLGLVAIPWIVFGQTLGFDFVNYDDSFYVYQNPSISDGLTWEGLMRPSPIRWSVTGTR